MSPPDPLDETPAAWRRDAMAAVLEAVAGLRNGRALVALMGCLFIGVLVSGLAGRMGVAGAVIGALAFLLASATGANAAGVLQLDQARGTPLRSLTDALVYGLICIPKVLGLGLVLLAVEFALLVALALVFVVCKLPLVGPLLYLIAFPLAVVAAGVTLFGLFLCFLIALPAIWEGRSVMRAIAQAGAVARARPVETLLLLALLTLLCMAVGIFIGAILGAGLVPVVALSAALLGEGGLSGFESLLTIAQGYGGAAYMVAALLGGGLLWALAVALIGQVYLRGVDIIYLRVTEGLDVDAAEAALANRLGDARRRAAALGDRARAAAAPERDPAPPAFTAPVPASFASSDRAGAAATSAARRGDEDAQAAQADAAGAPAQGAVHGAAESTQPGAETSPVATETRAVGAEESAVTGETKAVAAQESAVAAEARAVAAQDNAVAVAGNAAAVEKSSVAVATEGPTGSPASAPAASAAGVATSAHAEPAIAAPPAVTSPRPSAPPVAAAISCPKCAARCAARDVFCGVCGQRLR